MNAGDWLRAKMVADCDLLVRILLEDLAGRLGHRLKGAWRSERQDDTMHARFASDARDQSIAVAGLVGIEARGDLVATATLVPFLFGRRVTGQGFKNGTIEWECVLTNDTPAWRFTGWHEDADLEYVSLRTPEDIRIGAPGLKLI